MKLNPKKKKIALKVFTKNCPKFLPPKDLDMVMLTAVHDIIERRCAKTTKTLPMLNSARIEYSRGGTADGYKKRFLVHYLSYHMEAG